MGVKWRCHLLWLPHNEWYSRKIKKKKIGQNEKWLGLKKQIFSFAQSAKTNIFTPKIALCRTRKNQNKRSTKSDNWKTTVGMLASIPISTLFSFDIKIYFFLWWSFLTKTNGLLTKFKITWVDCHPPTITLVCGDTFWTLYWSMKH